MFQSQEMSTIPHQFIANEICVFILNDPFGLRHEAVMSGHYTARRDFNWNTANKQQTNRQIVKHHTEQDKLN
jgi:hypothetical protein